MLDIISKQFKVSYQDHKTCKFVADYLTCEYLKSTNLNDNEHVVIFSIVGDNRLPYELLKWLKHQPKERKYLFLVLGDYDNISSPPALIKAAMSYLSKSFNLSNIRVNFVDTPIFNSEYLKKSINFLFSSQCKEYTNNLLCENYVLKTCTKNPEIKQDLYKSYWWKKLCTILNQKPLVKCSSFDQSKLTIIFSDANIYSHSCIAKRTIQNFETILQCLSQIKTIIDIRLPFASLTELNTSGLDFGHVLKLDLRGNCINDFSFLASFPNLMWLNLGANQLFDVPIEIKTLKKLKALLLYKNQIKKIPQWLCELSELTRLTLYRNLLTELPDAIGNFPALQYLNIGANPLLKISKNIALVTTLQTFIIRNCRLASIPSHILKLNAKLDYKKNLSDD